MSKLDELKTKLTELKKGYAIEFHESVVAEALEKSAFSEFKAWCKTNKIKVFHKSFEDRIGFEKLSNAG